MRRKSGLRFPSLPAAVLDPRHQDHDGFEKGVEKDDLERQQGDICVNARDQDREEAFAVEDRGPERVEAKVQKDIVEVAVGVTG